MEILIKTQREEAVKTHPATMRKAKQILEIIGEDRISALDPDLYPSFDVELHPECRKAEIKSAHKMARRVFSQASEGAVKWGSPAGLGVDMFGEEELDEKARDWYNKMRQFEEIVQLVSTSKALGNKGMCKCRSGNLFFLGDEYFGVLKLDHVGDWYVISFSQLLMFKDMYYGRFNAMVGAWQLYRSPRLMESIKDCLEWFFKCIAIYGNKGYALGKGIEALAKANLIRRWDGVLGENGSYDDQLKGMIEKEKAMGAGTNFVTMELDSILRRDLPKAEMVELFGLQKLSGHPLIDPEVGGHSVREEAKKKISYKYSEVRRLRNNCCRLYLEGYVRKEKRWPPLTFRPEAKTGKLYQLYSLEERDINRFSYPLSDWEFVRFEKHHDFEYYPNFTDLMDDKSISFYRDEAAATWNSKIKTRSNRRLLLEMLSRPEISIREIVDRVRTGDIPYSWFIVSLYPKEREFKIAARMFSMMVFEMRAYFTATEANIAEMVFPYLPQQTMTLSKQEIQELFHKVTEASDDEDLERLFLEVDLTRWNLRWHPEVVDPVGQDLDDMFGLPGVYTAIHHFFSQCMILVRVPVCEPQGINDPNPPETDLLFYNHEVGFEGIGQKPWSFLTYGMIDLAAGDFSHRYYLIGQADNQIVLMSINCTDIIDRKEHLRATAARVKSRIQEECTKVGQEAKPDECLESTCVVTYSKDVYIEGVEHFTSVKAHSRIFPHSSSDFPSLDGSMGSISGQCLSAAEKTKEPMNSFALWCFHAALYWFRIRETTFVEAVYLSRTIKEILSDRAIYGLMILPGDLGGTQIAPVTSFFYKGGSDPLSKSYASLKFYQGGSALCRKFVYSLTSNEWFEKSPDLDILLDDPYGLPLKRPSTAENAIFQASKSKVNGLSRNRDIKELTSARIDKYGSDLRKLLKSCHPFNPILLSDILGWSVIGAQDTVSRMFTSTRTIQSLLQNDPDLTVCSKILSTGTGHFLNTHSRITGTAVGEREIVSIYSDIKRMRSHWGVKEGVEIAGVTSYVPFDLPLILGSNPEPREGFKSMSLRPLTEFPFHERGKEDPYLGRATVEKRSEHGFRIVTSSAPERAVKRLADIATQPGVSSSFRHMISKVAESRANVDLSQIYPLIGNSYGGTIAHRYASRLGLRSANGLGILSFASMCFLVNDDASPISGGEKDVPLMVQESMVLELSVLNMNRKQHSSSLFCTLCTDMTDWDFLPEDAMEVREVVVLETPFLEGNALATVPHILLKKTHGPHTSPFTKPLPDAISARYDPCCAARRVIGRSLEGSHSALAIADQGTGTIRFKIDLMELRGIGLSKLASLAAKEIGLTAIEALFAKSMKELRWTPTPMISTLSEAFARCIATAFLHPMFKEDPYVVHVMRPSPLKYSFSGKDPIKRIRDNIAQQALTLFQDPTSEIYTESEVIFSDDKDGISSKIVVRRFKAILLQGVLSGQCHIKTALNILRVQLPKALRSEHTEDGRLSSFYRLCVVLSDWSRDNGLLFLKDQFESLYSGKRIGICGIPAPELLRLARSSEAESKALEMERKFTPTQSVKWNVGLMELRLIGTSTPFHTLDTDASLSKTQLEEFDLTRLRGRVYGRESTSAYSYAPILDLVQGRICVIVGCGYGSGAALLLLSGVPMVFGLDLWDDCDERSLMLGMRVPPAISHTQTQKKFVRIQTSPSQTGDIRHPKTAHLINSHTGEHSVYLVDVPLQSAKDLQDIMSTLSLLRGFSSTYIRILNRVEVILDICLTLQASKIIPSVYPICTNDGSMECWISVSVPEVFTLRGAVTPAQVVEPPVNPEIPNLEMMGGGREDLVSSVEGPYSLLNDDDLTDGVLNAQSLLEMSTGDLDHRFTYRQWTEVIHILLFRNILHSDDPISCTRWALQQDVLEVTLGKHIIPISMTVGLRRMLTKSLPRLLPPKANQQ